MSSGRGNVGAQYRGGRGGRGGRGRGGSFGAPSSAWWDNGYGGQSGHGGFAGIGGFGGGGGGGGGRPPWQGNDGPMGHKYEDPRRRGRVQKNRARGRGGRGRGGARGGGQGTADKLNSWVSDQHYQKRETGARERPEGVNYDAQLNTVRADGAPLVEDGMLAVENRQRDRLTHSRASQYEAADVKSGDFLGMNLKPGSVHSLMARADRTQPEGTRYNVRIKAVSAEDGAASSEVIKGRFCGAMLSTADPFAFDPDQDGMEVDPPPQSSPSPRRTADETMRQQHQKDAAQESNYQQGSSTFIRDPNMYKGI